MGNRVVSAVRACITTGNLAIEDMPTWTQCNKENPEFPVGSWVVYQDPKRHPDGSYVHCSVQFRVIGRNSDDGTYQLDHKDRVPQNDLRKCLPQDQCRWLTQEGKCRRQPQTNSCRSP